MVVGRSGWQDRGPQSFRGLRVSSYVKGFGMQSLHDELEMIGFQRAQAAQRGEHTKADLLRQQMNTILGTIQAQRKAIADATAPEVNSEA